MVVGGVGHKCGRVVQISISSVQVRIRTLIIQIMKGIFWVSDLLCACGRVCEICMSVCLCLYFCVCMCVCLFVCLSVCLFVCLDL